MSAIAMDPAKEKRIIKAARKNKENFGPIYEHYNKHIFNFFKFRVNDRETADELTSTTFEKALKGIDNFQWQGVPFSAWLFRIARNTLIDHYRKSEKRKKETQIDENYQQLTDHETPQSRIEVMMSEDLLYKVINDLPIRERDIIYMKFFDGYTNRLISKLTGLSETNVGTIIYRTLRKLRSMYKENRNEFVSRGD